MIIMFLLGGILSTVLCYYFDVRAIWGAFFILAILFVRLIVADTTYEKELLKKVPRGH